MIFETAQPFLRQTGWQHADVTELTSDASLRQYWRLSKDANVSVILMYDPQHTAPRVVRMARVLADSGLQAPDVLALDPPFGLVTDLGPLRLIDVSEVPEVETTAYAAVGTALAQLQTMPTPLDLSIADADYLSEIVAPFHINRAAHSTALLKSALSECLRNYPAETVILRDCHAENITWRKDLEGLDRLGFLDVQDGMIGPAVYDLASLLTDARRDVRPEAERAALTAFLDRSGRDASQTTAALAVLSLQRNLRILGLFAQFARDGRTGYGQYVGRVRRHVARALHHPACQPMIRALPEYLS